MIDDLRHQLAVQGRRPVRDAHELVSPWPDAPASLTDLRGIEVGAEGLAIDHLTITRVVLSFSRGKTSCFQSEIHDSRFDAVELAGQPRFTRRFKRSSFRGADLTRVAVGPHVIDCDFTDARAPRLESAPDTASERCRFDGADLRGAVFRHATFIDCSFVGVKFSEATVFDRCSPQRTALDSGDARLTRVMRDGVSLPDQWPGEAEWNATEERYLDRYRRAFLAGDAETMSLDPYDRDLE
ncbi:MULTISPECIES: pentapeptide repeat-containing protein [Clavibacter]|nr:pentapeptide repeat-containing protein [Clavibacter michiganensis]MBT1634199.1 pentapeptide repeat-containing protein [Clavibacter michiganensis]